MTRQLLRLAARARLSEQLIPALAPCIILRPSLPHLRGCVPWTVRACEGGSGSCIGLVRYRASRYLSAALLSCPTACRLYEGMSATADLGFNGPGQSGRAVPDPGVLRPPRLRADPPSILRGRVQDAGRISLKMPRAERWKAALKKMIAVLQCSAQSPPPSRVQALAWGKIKLRSLWAAGHFGLPYRFAA